MPVEPRQTRQLEWIVPTTDANLSGRFMAYDADTIVVSADNLAGAETVNILMISGRTTLQVLMSDNITPATLTAVLQGLVLKGGPTYLFDKSATAGACGVYVDVNRP